MNIKAPCNNSQNDSIKVQNHDVIARYQSTNLKTTALIKFKIKILSKVSRSKSPNEDLSVKRKIETNMPQLVKISASIKDQVKML